MKIVSGAKHAAVLAGAKRIARELEDEKKANAGHVATISRLRAELDQLRDAKPTSPLPQPQPVLGDAELRRQLHLAQRTIRVQADQLEQMQASHVADTRELHDLRQGVAS